MMYLGLRNACVLDHDMEVRFGIHVISCVCFLFPNCISVFFTLLTQMGKTAHDHAITNKRDKAAAFLVSAKAKVRAGD